MAETFCGLNVLDEVKKEHTEEFEFSDERILSNVFYVSQSFNLRSLAGERETVRKEKEKKNNWLINEFQGIEKIAILDFDNIMKKLSNGKRSCDGLFYNFQPEGDEYHYLIELKGANKKEVLQLLRDSGNNGIYAKVNDSVQMIKKQLCFGGIHEGDEIVNSTHFIIVYAGQNNVPVRTPLQMPKKVPVESDRRGKQKKASRNPVDTFKKEDELLKQFGEKVKKLGLKYCDENTFPGDALPRVRKSDKGQGKIRDFTMISARDFAEIIKSVFFDMWKWGSYQEYMI